MTFSELKQFYSDHFSVGYFLNPSAEGGHSPFERKLILISLINYITYKTKLKHPDVTHYEIICKLSKNTGLSEDFIRALAIICEDFAYQCTEFPTFGLKGQDIIKECTAILNSYMPF